MGIVTTQGRNGRLSVGDPSMRTWAVALLPLLSIHSRPYRKHRFHVKLSEVVFLHELNFTILISLGDRFIHYSQAARENFQNITLILTVTLKNSYVLEIGIYL